MGRAAVNSLLAQIRGEETGSEELLFEPELVVRRSTSPARHRVPAARSEN
jgi:LacI family transcriptional regulator, repressor for deo operon, udp, cdd, tsx, nupC, and nupG